MPTCCTIINLTKYPSQIVFNHIGMGVEFFLKLLIRHTLDLMHIEKNVCESLIKFLFGTNDTIKVCHDIEVCGV
jgi:hypothetical protein